ncbi:hypothetical protein [Mangrovactinospora gilvigrisea]|nr:hypothetical protein [Mangrovactinospora gilvigrisea]
MVDAGIVAITGLRTIPEAHAFAAEAMAEYAPMPVVPGPTGPRPHRRFTTAAPHRAKPPQLMLLAQLGIAMQPAVFALADARRALLHLNYRQPWSLELLTDPDRWLRPDLGGPIVTAPAHQRALLRLPAMAPTDLTPSERVVLTCLRRELGRRKRALALPPGHALLIDNHRYPTATVTGQLATVAVVAGDRNEDGIEPGFPFPSSLLRSTPTSPGDRDELID